MTSTFATSERVLCYHGPLIYEAKVLKSENWDQINSITGALGPHYYVHYKGWKQTWDEWVPAQRLLKWNDTNLSLQKAIASASAAANASASASGSSHKKGTGGGNKDAGGRSGGRKDGTRGTKRGREEDEGNKKPEMKLNVPEALKIQLVDDWEAVTKNNQLVTVPRNPTVVDILQEFQDYVSSLPKTNLRDPSLLLPTITSGLQVYFDRSLGANLLYRFERPQYADIRKQFVTGPKVIVGAEKEMSAIYGAEHFLRMLVAMPQMVAASTMDAESVAIIRDYVNELFVFLLKERQRFFVAEYENASIPYQNTSRS